MWLQGSKALDQPLPLSQATSKEQPGQEPVVMWGAGCRAVQPLATPQLRPHGFIAGQLKCLMTNFYHTILPGNPLSFKEPTHKSPACTVLAGRA